MRGPRGRDRVIKRFIALRLGAGVGGARAAFQAGRDTFSRGAAVPVEIKRKKLRAF